LGNVGHNVITATWLHLTQAVPARRREPDDGAGVFLL
jgi:hypothetical protein